MFLKALAAFCAFVLLSAALYAFVGGRGSGKGEVVITDSDVAATDAYGSTPDGAVDASTDAGAPVQDQAGPSSESWSNTLLDGSSLTTITDQYGSRSETRVFKSHSRIRMLVVRTAADGSRSVYIHPHLGGVRQLFDPANFDVKTISADELAERAEVFETRLDKQRQQSAFSMNRDRNQDLDDSTVGAREAESESGKGESDLED